MSNRHPVGARLAAFGVMVAALLGAPAIGAQGYTFIPIDVPGAAYVVPSAINARGQVAGTFWTPTSTFLGFLQDASGSVTTIPKPATPRSGPGLSVMGINDAGQVVGHYYDGPYAYGFVRDAGGALTSLAAPGGRSTYLLDINAAGQIVGHYVDVLVRHNFLYSVGVFTPIAPPDAAFDLWVNGINDRGQMVGSYRDATGQHGFLRDPSGGFHTLDVPGARATDAVGINNFGQVAGNYTDQMGRNYGFVYSAGEFHTIDGPGAPFGTSVYDVNDDGHIVGHYGDLAGGHPFIAVPVQTVPEPGSLALLAAGLGGIGATARWRTHARARAAG